MQYANLSILLAELIAIQSKPTMLFYEKMSEDNYDPHAIDGIDIEKLQASMNVILDSEKEFAKLSQEYMQSVEDQRKKIQQ